jgi:hypothetical protein
MVSLSFMGIGSLPEIRTRVALEVLWQVCTWKGSGSMSSTSFALASRSAYRNALFVGVAFSFLEDGGETRPKAHPKSELKAAFDHSSNGETRFNSQNRKSLRLI